ncbi:ABC transporter ATP-binding protein [Polynucleobacter paneuropaeus]|nr:ABC transporter ATP-binding protein [Polynucleobacter paneuropaeus]
MGHPQQETSLFSRLWKHLGEKRRLQFFLLLGLIFLVSLLDVLSIGAVFPFLGVLTSPERVFDYPPTLHLIRYLGFSSPQQLLFPVTMVFVIATLVSGVMRLCLLWFQNKFSHAVGADFSHEIYWRTLHQTYIVHTHRNSSEIIAAITSKSSQIVNTVILPLLIIINSSFLMIILLSALMLIDWRVSICSLVGFGLIYGLVMLVTRKRLSTYSKQIHLEQNFVLKALQEGLGGIRDVLIDSSQNFYSKLYKDADHKLRAAQANIQIIGGSPRYFVETLGMVLIGGLAYTLATRSNGFAAAIPILGAMALAAQRLLPALQQAYFSWTSIQGSRDSLAETLRLLDQPVSEYALSQHKNIDFAKKIQIQNLCFQYSPDSILVLKNIDLVINKGDRVGIIGGTGSGKTTLADILMGLLQPSSGVIKVDGVPVDGVDVGAWQKHIAHVPQSIFLADATVLENIAFGMPYVDINIDRVKSCAVKAHIASTIESLPEKYMTKIGERGIRLSGGQRQRIGIARALYKQADVLVFDEATSALDGDTEASVIEAIESLDPTLTIFMVAHRLTTLKKCNLIVELEQGSVKHVGTYQELIGA